MNETMILMLVLIVGDNTSHLNSRGAQIQAAPMVMPSMEVCLARAPHVQRVVEAEIARIVSRRALNVTVSVVCREVG